MKVSKGKTVLARGEVKIEGEVEVLGAELDSFVSDKHIPIYCKGDCEIEVKGDYLVVEGRTIPESWDRLAEAEWDSLFIFGGTDSGKSTLAAYLANKSDGCYVLDLDIGQSDIAHPGAMGYGFVNGCVSVSQAEMINGFFAGVISPMGREVKCLRGVSRLWKELEKRNGRKIVDTTGWIRGAKAREYKLAKLEIIQPDIIASFHPTPNFLNDWKVFEVERGYVVERSREERSRIRASRYAKELEGAKGVKVDAAKVTNTNFFGGREIPKEFMEDVLGCKIISVRKGDDFLTILVEEHTDVEISTIRALRELYDVEDVYVLSYEDLRGLVVGLYSGRRYLGMGLLEDIGDKQITLKTRHRGFDRVEFGEFRLFQGKEYIVRIP
jgi:polynucleotide 5'-hydroxyl-kinase GRC3/NOL9